MPEKSTLSWWKIALIVPLAILVLPLAIIGGLIYFLASAFFYLSIWLLWFPRGKDVLFVYSDSPIWSDYLKAEILPKIEKRAIVLNWSKRKMWKISLARFAFVHFGGYREFNPLGVVFRPWRRAQVFRFWQPFREWKHGRPEALKKIQLDFLSALKN